VNDCPGSEKAASVEAIRCLPEGDRGGGWRADRSVG
jgi:hypothetical protein